MTLLSKAFQEMRKNGLVAKQNFTCCQSCGSSEGWEEVKKEGKLGLVFYTHQDKENKKKGYLYLSYSGWDEAGRRGTKEVGESIVRILLEYGLGVEWNGSIDTRIKVLLPKERI